MEKTFVDINILGLALCYQKPNENWKVMIPWNHCHKALFSYGREQERASTPISLGVPDQQVKISASNAISLTGQSGSFDREVFDFTTDFKTSEYDTHENVFLKDEWSKGTVLLELENAFFSVANYVQTRTSERPVNRNGNDVNGGTLPGQEIKYNIAHSLRAQITLAEAGVLTVTRTVGTPTEIARISEDGSFIITFNNDCKDITHNRNDMFLYYENTICGGTQAAPRPKERFWVGAVGKAPQARTGVILEEGKPCMGAQVTPPPPDFP